MITRIQPGARMSEAVIHGDTIYLSGQVGEPGDDVIELLAKNWSGPASFELEAALDTAPFQVGLNRFRGGLVMDMIALAEQVATRAHAEQTGMARLRMDGWSKVLLGHTSIEEILRVTL